MAEMRWESEFDDLIAADAAMCAEFPGFDVNTIARAVAPPSVTTSTLVFLRALTLAADEFANDEASVRARALIIDLTRRIRGGVHQTFSSSYCAAVAPVLTETVHRWEANTPPGPVGGNLELHEMERFELLDVLRDIATACEYASMAGYLQVR